MDRKVQISPYWLPCLLPSETAVIPLGLHCSYPIRVRDGAGRQTKPGAGLECCWLEATEGEAALPKDRSPNEFILWTMAGSSRLGLSPRQGLGLGMKLVLELWDYFTFYLIK